ncbi:MAG: nucleoid-structuring protein H-NS, partial [candidate division KSB1 bacterium]|nr:nucleoid-structuring protein H-NS [candidate division KSB1 bacterium]
MDRQDGSDMTAFDEIWVSGRSGLKLLDCTIRDGGLMNNHRFSEDTVKAVFNACAASGIDIIEIGYRASKKIFYPNDYGKWKYCSEEDVRRIVGEGEYEIKLAVMTDAERTDYHEDIPPKEKSIFEVIRVSTYVHQLPEAVDMIHDAHQKGYFTTANIMAVSKVTEAELDRALEMLV